MKNSAFLLPTFFYTFFVSTMLASPKLSIYDPLGALGNEERVKLEAEGQALITSREVSGQDVLIQIDFLSKHEFEEGGIKGRDAEGKTLFSLGTYANWSARYFTGPAVLMLFLDQGDGTYVLDALNFSDMLMDEGIPDLVRRYIRDEIMRKEIGYEAIISSGLYAIGEALNPVYRERLERKGNEMLNTDKRYHKAHCVYGDCDYYEFTPGEKSIIGPTQPKNAITFHGLPESRPGNLESVINTILTWNHTHEKEIVSNWPWIRDNSTEEYILNPNIKDGYFPVRKNNPWSVLNTSSETKNVGELLPRMAWLQIHGWPATYCNFFSQDLSFYIFDHLPWRTGKVANEIHDYIVSNKNFIKIEIVEDNSVFTNLGYLVYYTKKGAERSEGSFKAGHIATGWIQEGKIIQAGASTGILSLEQAFRNTEGVSVHLYLGHLRKKA